MTRVVCYGTDWNCIKEQLLVGLSGFAIIMGILVIAAVVSIKTRDKE